MAIKKVAFLAWESVDIEGSRSSGSRRRRRRKPSVHAGGGAEVEEDERRRRGHSPSRQGRRLRIRHISLDDVQFCHNWPRLPLAQRRSDTPRPARKFQLEKSHCAMHCLTSASRLPPPPLHTCALARSDSTSAREQLWCARARPHTCTPKGDVSESLETLAYKQSGPWTRFHFQFFSAICNKYTV